MKISLLRSLRLMTMLLLLLAPSVFGQAGAPTSSFRLNKIEVAGLRKISKDKVIEASNLKLGQDVDVSALKTAANRLQDTGWFNSVTFHYQFADGRMDVTFEVEEKVLAVGPVKLGTIEFLGLQHIERELALKECGLQSGQMADQALFEVAAKRLLDTGYFSRTTFRYQQVGEQMQLTFEVTERRWDVPCVFDNFAWFTDQEIVEVIRREVPPFNGSAPEIGGVAERITKILNRLIQQRGLAGHISYNFLASSLDGSKPEHVFSVIGVQMPVCSVQLTGVSVAASPQLLKAVKPLINTQYSRSQLRVFVENNLLSYYKQRGFLRAEVGSPQVKLADGADKKCKNGLNVNLPVTEGAAYLWDKAEWEGNQLLTSADLNEVLKMRSDAPADGQKLDMGLDAVRMAYGKKGYVDAKLKPKPSFNDANRRVLYRIAVDEGRQYRMGRLMITGLSEKDNRQLQERWKLKTDEVFDASYPQEFQRKFAEQNNGRVPSISLKPEHEKLSVDVVLTF